MNSIFFNLCFVFLSIGVWTCDSTLQYSSSPSECGFIFLSVSSLVKDQLYIRRDPYIDDKLELNWDITHCNGQPDSQIPDQVALFNVNPESVIDAPPLEVVNIADHKWNYYVTDVSLGLLAIPELWRKKYKRQSQKPLESSGPICVPFWIASFKEGTLLKTNCLKLHPTWMADISKAIGDIPLSKILIPGSHDAGSYGYPPSRLRNVLQRYVLCQDRDIWTQLVSGIRYLDMRIAFYETLQSLFRPDKRSPDNFWINHGVIRVTPLLPVLRDIRRFMDATTDEIVIFDIHELSVGFNTIDGNHSRHDQLLDLLKQEFGDHILGFGDVLRITKANAGPTVNEIISTGKRLIVTYPNKLIIGENTWLWPQVTHKWGNTNDPYILKNYLDSVMKDPNIPEKPGSNPLWSAMAQTTPTALDILLNTNGSLRKNADAVNRNLTLWVLHEWPDKANIVSSDFYMGNNLMEIMVHLNELKGKFFNEAPDNFIYKAIKPWFGNNDKNH